MITVCLLNTSRHQQIRVDSKSARNWKTSGNYGMIPITRCRSSSLLSKAGLRICLLWTCWLYLTNFRRKHLRESSRKWITCANPRFASPRAGAVRLSGTQISAPVVPFARAARQGLPAWRNLAAAATCGYVKVSAGNAKNSKSRNAPVTGRVLEMLQRRKPSKTGYVFHRSDGQALYQTWMNQQHSN